MKSRNGKKGVPRLGRPRTKFDYLPPPSFSDDDLPRTRPYLGDKGPRLADYMKPEDLDLSGCLSLVCTLLSDQANEYWNAAQLLLYEPGNAKAQAHMANLRRFYRSKWFSILSCGAMEGEDVMRDLDRRVKKEVLKKWQR